MKGFATIIFSKAVKLKLSTRKECGRGPLAVKTGLLFSGFVFFPESYFLVQKWFVTCW